jgi:PIN domain nuclease of toxin-antitoxin system
VGSDAVTLLLDTHIWLWLGEDDSRLTATIARAARRAAREGNLLVSPISAWEIAMLQTKGRLDLGMPVEHWLAQALDFPGLNIATLTPQIAAASCLLPDLAHADPADRILIATAQANGAALATADRRILDYAKRGHVTVLE